MDGIVIFFSHSMEALQAKRESARKASADYRARQLAENPQQFIERQRGYARKCFKVYYHTNEEYRIRHLNRAKEKAYYDNSDDKFFLAIRRLYIL